MKKNILRCPECSFVQKEEMPTDACVPFYVCDNCKKTIPAKKGDCCVFCSYSDQTCPLAFKGDKK